MIDPALQAPAVFMRTTVKKFPASADLAKQAKIPLGTIVQPLADNPDGSDIDVVNFGALGVQRCRSCRGYINAFVQWIESGRRWRCNLCGLANDTPSQYYSHLDSTGRRVDAVSRPELRGGVYEIVAPADYMVRAPQSPVYVFVVDVSADSVARGVLQVAVDAIKACLDTLVGTGRTQVAFLTFDSTVHFYNLRAGLCEPQMLVVSDIDDMFIPIPEGMSVCLCTLGLYVNVTSCIFGSVYVCIYVYMFLCINVSMYIYIYMYIYVSMYYVSTSRTRARFAT
jgi:protein transport protein SEC24